MLSNQELELFEPSRCIRKAYNWELYLLEKAYNWEWTLRFQKPTSVPGAHFSSLSPSPSSLPPPFLPPSFFPSLPTFNQFKSSSLLSRGT